MSVLWGGARFGRSSRVRLVGVLSGGVAVTWACAHQSRHAAASTEGNSTSFGANPEVPSHGPLFIDATPLRGRSAIRALSRVYNSVIKFRAGFDFNSERKLHTVGESWERIAGRLPASQFLVLLPSEMGSGPRRLHDIWRPRPKVWQSGLSHQASVTPQVPGVTSWNLVADLSWKERRGSH